jgi:hypothetical protein
VDSRKAKTEETDRVLIPVFVIFSENIERFDSMARERQGTGKFWLSRSRELPCIFGKRGVVLLI